MAKKNTDTVLLAIEVHNNEISIIRKTPDGATNGLIDEYDRYIKTLEDIIHHLTNDLSGKQQTIERLVDLLAKANN